MAGPEWCKVLVVVREKLEEDPHPHENNIKNV